MPNRDPIKNRLNIRRNQAARNQKANQAAKRDGLLDEDGQPLTGSKAFTRWKNGEHAMIETKTLVALGALLRELEWVETGEVERCPSCNNYYRKQKHEKNCELDRLLKLLPKESEKE